MKSFLMTWLVAAAFAQAQGLVFEQIQQDIKAPSDAATVTADFAFTNRGSKPVKIAKTDPGCSCLQVQISGGKLDYAPGESGVIRATFDMGNFSGTVDKTVALWIDNDPPSKPSTQLSVRVHIPVLVALEPKTVKWDIGGNTDPQVIHIQMAEGKTIHVTQVTSSSDAFALELKTLEKGKKYDLSITPKSTGAPGISVIRIETDCEISKHRTQQAFAVVRKPLPGNPQ